MSDAEARAKAEEWLAQRRATDIATGRIVPIEITDAVIASLAALLRAAGAGTWSDRPPTAVGWYRFAWQDGSARWWYGVCRIPPDDAECGPVYIEDDGSREVFPVEDCADPKDWLVYWQEIKMEPPR